MGVLARIFTILFHPLLLATYLFGLFTIAFPVGMAPIKEDGQWNFVLLIFFVTFVLPAMNLLIFKTFGTIKSLALESRAERVVPFSFISILYVAVTYLFYSRTQIDIDDNLLKFLIIIDLLVVLATVITFFYKISVHSMAIWGLIGILIPLNRLSEQGMLFYPTVGAIALAGFIMTARLQLNAHTPREVITGAIVGLVASFGSMMFIF
ncbi:MAG: hypothetical protein WKF87_18740 [Chryseolinea sp.]